MEEKKEGFFKRAFREMKEVRKLLFEDDEIVIQYHPPKEKYIFKLIIT